MLNVRSIMFESPWALVPILVFIELVLLQIWQWRRSVLTGRLAAGGLAAIPLLIVLQVVVVTDAERIRSLCRRMAAAVGRGDIPGLGGHIADGFHAEIRGETWGKTELLAGAKRALTRWDVQEERLGGFEIDLEDDEARVNLRATCRLITEMGIIPRHVSFWRLTLRRTNGSWEVVHVKPIRSRWMPYDTLEDLLR